MFLPDSSISIRTTDFHILKRGELFKYKGKKYKKTSDSAAQLISSKTKVTFSRRLNY